jgi:acyl-CoA synthetase (AMP-forming)/AMP-acid ligase II
MRVIDFFDKAVGAWPERVAFVDAESSHTYRSMQEISHRIAVALARDGQTDCARVAIYSPNRVQAFTCVIGALRAGDAWVPINARNALEDNVDFMNLAQCEWLFYHSSFRADAAALQQAVPTLKHVVCIDQRNDAVRSLADLLEGTEGHLAPDLQHDPHRMTAVLGTGGTTGRSKGVMWDNLTWETLIAQTTINLVEPPDAPPPVHLCVAPMTHAAGILSFMLLPIGPTNVVLDKADPLEIMQSIARYRVTHLYLPPTVLYAMLAHSRVREFDYSSLRHFIVAASPVAPDKLAEAVEVFGPCMCQFYGQAEAPMVVTFLSQREIVAATTDPALRKRLMSCGRANVLTRVAIMDDAGALLPDGERGEIVLQGNLVAPCYFRNPEATEEVSRFGWHHTGDIAYRDPDGFLFIVDRKKDMIITGGFNVFSTEVEAVINGHPAVENCAVVGVPHPKWGEAVKAVVVLKPGQELTEQLLIDFVKHRIGSVKAPKTVEFWPELPRSPVGKVVKTEIRARYWVGKPRAVG